MDGTQDDLERKVLELRAQVAGLRRTIINGFIALAGLLVILLVPGLNILGSILGILVIIFAAFVMIFGTIGAVLGSCTGRAIRRTRRGLLRPHAPH